MRVRPLALLTALLVALALGGCGNKHAVVTHAETEGIYIDVGELDYQIQGSRVLNPDVDPDRQYLAGLPETEGGPSREETWFAVFIRVDNHTDEEHTTASEFEIVDTQEETFEPIELDVASNQFAYESRGLEAGHTLPAEGSLTGEGPNQGALLLFKLPYETLQNRPLEFKIKPSAPGGEEGVVDLDV